MSYHPNGMPGSEPISFRNTVPIRNMATGLSDMTTSGAFDVKSTKFAPRIGPRPDTSGSVPLESDEEDFLDHDSFLRE